MSTGLAEEDPEREDTSRVEGFSDAVFAVAITVLVFDLRPPREPPGHLLHGLLAQWPVYVSYLASFLYVGVIWMNHHAAFTRIRRVDRSLRLMNLGILLHTALIPFPTAVMAATLQENSRADSRVAVALYALIGALMCGSWLVFFHHLHRRRRLVERGVHERFFAEERTRAWIGVVLYAIGGAAGTLAIPEAGLAVFLALPVFFALTSDGLLEFRSGGERTRRRRRVRSRAARRA
jgi:uncharacterized membrane protein